MKLLGGDAKAEERYGLSIELVIANISFVVLIAAIVWGVLSRYVTKQPATWVEEVSSMAFAWTVFVGAAEVQRRRKHVSVDLVTSLLPTRLRLILEILAASFVALYCGYLCWLSLQQAIISNSAHTSMLRIPLSVGYAGPTLGFLFMALRSLQQILRRPRPV
jgi:TRAP-type C4-dicarboxylate transport system permease small subunit